MKWDEIYFISLFLIAVLCFITLTVIFPSESMTEALKMFGGL